jgi:hypothetical protein
MDVHIGYGDVIGAVLVALYAWARYGTPKENRVSTTKGQFYGTAALYILSALGLYFVLTKALATKGVLELLAGGAAPTGDATKLTPEGAKLSAPFLAALLMTTLLPNFPGLTKIDEFLLRFFQDLGAIPAEVERLARQLRVSPYDPPVEAQARIKNHIKDDDGIPDSLIPELRFGCDDSARAKFTRAISIYIELEQLAADRTFAKFFAAFEDEVKKFEDKMQTFIAQSAGYFTFARLVPEEKRDEAPFEDARSAYKKQCKETYGELSHLLARALLDGSWTGSDVRSYLRTLGFGPIAHAAPLPFNRIVTAVLSVFLLFAAVLWITHPAGQGSTAPNFLGPLLIAVNHGLAATIALYVKRNWAFAMKGAAGERPMAAYLLSAVLAALAAAATSFGFQILRQPNLGQAWIYFQHFSPWILSPATGAFGLAFLCDDGIAAEAEPGWERWAEAAALGLALGLAGYVALSWQLSLDPLPGRAPDVADTARIMLRVIGLGCGAGALLGWLIPHGYRTEVRAVRRCEPCAALKELSPA